MVMEFKNISEFYDNWFMAHQGFVNHDTKYEIKLVKNNVEYLKIRAFVVPEIGRKYIRVILYNQLDFKVTPPEFENLLFMLSCIYSWHDEYADKYVVDNIELSTLEFISNSSHVLLGKEYRMMVLAYCQSIEDELLTKNEASDWFENLLKTWDNLTHSLTNITTQVGLTESNSHNYYTDDKGQDMFAKFESLDDFREQTYALGFCYHNIEKYLVRAGRKTDDPTEDINKALDYLHEYRKLQKIYFE